MYLKSLTLKGFKSFADKTPLVFQDGLNVVVGPNGSGKSNVADAILWVLGEQSAKQLRGQAMEDVIFSGSAERKSVSVAEVTLTLSNEDGTLPLDFSEIAITRRMYRTGESEYFINESPSRLLDITDILHDSGLGRETSSIISQGKLDAVLSNRPEDRRELVEEAAGIAKHRRRKNRAERKLARMDEHVARAKIINRELNRRLRPLEDQVGKAQTFKELETERIELETEFAVDDVRRLHFQYSELMTKKQEAEAQASLLEYEEKEKQKHLEALQTMLEKRGLYVGDLSEQRRLMASLEAKMESNLTILKEKTHNLSERTLTSAAQIRNVSAQIASNEKRAHDFEQNLEKAQAKERKAAAAVEAYRPKTDELTKTIKQAEDERAALLKQKAQVTKNYDEALLAQTKLQHEVDSHKLQGGIWVERVASLDTEITQRQKQVISLEKDEEIKGKLKQNTEAKVAQLDEELRKTQEDSAAARNTYTTLQESTIAQTAELHALEELLATDDNQTLPAPLKKAYGQKTIQTRLSAYVAFPKTLEALAETILGSYLNAAVVNSSKELHTLVQELVSAEDGYVGSFLTPSGDTQGKSSDAGVPSKVSADSVDSSGGASGVSVSDNATIGNAVSFPALFEQERLAESAGKDAPSIEEKHLVSRLFANVYVTDNAKDALTLSKKYPDSTFASQDGLVAFSNGILSVGATVENENSQLAQSRRLRELKASVPALEKKCTASLKTIEELKEKEARLVKEREREQAALLKATADVELVSAALAREQKQIEDCYKEKTTIETSQQQALEEAKKSEAKLAEYTDRISQASATNEALDEEIGRLSKQTEELQKQEIEYLKNLNEAELSLKAARESVSRIEAEQKEFIQFREQSDKSIHDLHEGRARMQVQLERVEPVGKVLQEVLGVIQNWVHKLQDSAAHAVSDSAELRETIDSARQEAEHARAAHARAQDACNKIEIEEGKIEVRVNGAVETLKEVASMSVDEALMLEPLADREEKATRLAEVKEALVKLGPVNQVALTEYDDLKERAAFYANQLEDLKLARRALAKITKAIDARMRGAFEETFKQVNEHFAETFALFFPGGKAHLELSDPDNIEETGIEIIAQPKGKRIPKIALMSGGEKSLTALAFLFAIYQTHTVPFYVFDEVEAALDDANLDKFIDAVEMLKQTTQLIVISHQRRTMEAADVLYGVSMQSDGISKVVSQKLDEYEKKFLEA